MILKFLPILILIPIVVFVLTVKALNIGFHQNPTEVETVQSVTTPTPGPSFTLVSTGDIGLVRDVNFKIKSNNNPKLPFINIAPFLRDADLTITNLEGPLISNCPVVLTGFTFCGEDVNVDGLVFAGIDAASLANNHSTNYGQPGLAETAQILKSKNIDYFGLENQIVYKQVGVYKIALLGFVELGSKWPGLSNATPQNVTKLVREARENSDIVIAAFHWGNEYTYKPTESQMMLAHLSIDSGADLILGNHPHWIQPIEIYKDKYIVYAQGNTIFDQDWSVETREGVLYKFEYMPDLKKGRFKKIDEKFTIIEDNWQPRFATEEEITRIKKNVLTF